MGAKQIIVSSLLYVYLLIGFSLLYVTLLSADEPITLSLDPVIGYDPLTTHATIRIDPHYLNYEVCVEWVGEPQEGRGCWSLEGQYSRRTHSYDITALPAGEYQVVARLKQVRSSYVTSAQTVRSIENHFK